MPTLYEILRENEKISVEDLILRYEKEIQKITTEEEFTLRDKEKLSALWNEYRKEGNPIHVAIRLGRPDLPDLIKSLLDFAAKYNKGLSDYPFSLQGVNAENQNCLEYAIEKLPDDKVLDVLRIFLQHPIGRFAIKSNNSLNTQTPNRLLKLLFAKKDPCPIMALRMLLESNPSLDPKIYHPSDLIFDFNAFELLHEVIALEPNKKAEELLQVVLQPPTLQHLNLNALDGEGYTPLMRAVLKNDPIIVRSLLMLESINPNIKEEKTGRTALHMAAALKGIDPEIIKSLLAAGASVEEADEMNATPQSLAAKQDSIILAILSSVKEGPDLNVDPIRQDKTFKAFHDRVQAIKSVPMTEKLFAHIHLDTKLLGTTLQGMLMSNTSKYTLECMRLYLKYHEKELDDTEVKSLQDTIKRFECLVDLSDDYEDATIQGRSLVQKYRYDEKGKRRTAEDKISSEYVSKILKRFDDTNSILMPGGWSAGTGGHAMVYGLERIAGDKLIFSIYNSGAGINYHEMRETKRKQRYNPELQIEIPNVAPFNLKAFLEKITQAGLKSFWEREGWDEEKHYEEILKNIPANAKILPARKDAKFIDPQISGTCAWKVMTTVFKNSLPAKPNNLRENMRIFIKTQALIDYFTIKSADHELGKEKIKQELLDGIAKLNRLVLKSMAKATRQRETTQQPKKTKQKTTEQYQDILALCDYMQKTIEAQSKTMLEVPISGQKALFEYQVKDRFDRVKGLTKFEHSLEKRTRTKGRPSEPQREEMETKDLKDRADKELVLLPVQFTKNRTKHDFVHQKGSDVLRQELEKINKMVEDGASNKIILKTIEDLFLNIPLDPKYWSELTQKQVFDALPYLAGLLGQYTSALAGSPTAGKYRLPSQRLAIYSLSTILSLLGSLYFDKSSDTPFIKIRKELQDLIKEILSNPLYIHDDPRLDERLKEIEQTLNLLEKKALDKQASTQATEKRKSSSAVISFEDLAQKYFKDEPKRLEELLTKGIEEYNKGISEEQDKITNREQIVNKELFALGVALKIKREDSPLPKKLYEDCMALAYAKGMEQNIDQVLRKLSYPDILDSNMNFNQLISIATDPNQKLRETDQTTFTCEFKSTFERYEHPKMGKKEVAKKMPFSFLDHKFLEEFHFSDFEGPLRANAIQVHGLGAKSLTAKVGQLRSLLHTHLASETQVAVTLDRFQSLIQDLSDLDYQNLLTANLLQPGLLQDSLKRSPALAESLLELIEEGLNYYTEEGKLDNTAAFFHKLNQDFIGFLEHMQQDVRFQKDERIQKALTRAELINKRLDDDIENNAIRILAKDSKNVNQPLLSGDLRDNAILLQIRLYYCSMQRLTRNIRNEQKKKESVEESDRKKGEIIAKYLEAKFYINSQNITAKKREYQVDPLSLDKEDSLYYYMQSALKNYLINLKNKLGNKALLDFVINCLPAPDVDYVKKIMIDAEIKFEYPELILIWKDPGTKQQKETKILLGPDDFSVSEAGAKRKKLPVWAVEKCEALRDTRLFPTMPMECIDVTNLDFEAVQFEYTERGIKNGIKHQYRIDRGSDGTTRLMKQVMIVGEPEPLWLEYFKGPDTKKGLSELTSQVGLAAGILSKFTEQGFPAFLTDRNMQAWVSPAKLGDSGDNVIVFTDTRTGKDNYILRDGRLYLRNEEGSLSDYQVVKLGFPPELTSTLRGLIFEKSSSKNETPFDFLMNFEAPQFIEVQKKSARESGTIIKFPRYVQDETVLEFRSKEVNGRDELVWQQDPNYAIDLHNGQAVIDGLPNALRLKPISLEKEDKEKKERKEIALIPVCPLIAPKKGDRKQNACVLDIEGNYLEDLRLEKVGEEGVIGQFNAKAWDLAGTQRFAKFQIGKDGELIASSSSDYLYLAYLYSSNDKMDEAFKALQKFEELGGFSGLREDAQILSWMFATRHEFKKQGGEVETRTYSGVPYIMKSEPKQREYPVVEQLSTPELWAFRSKLLGNLVNYLGSQGTFKFESDKTQAAFEMENERIAYLLKKENRKNLEDLVVEHLEQYQKLRRNVRARFRLNTLEHYNLFHFLPENKIKSFPSYIKDSQLQLKEAYQRMLHSSKLDLAEKPRQLPKLQAELRLARGIVTEPIKFKFITPAKEDIETAQQEQELKSAEDTQKAPLEKSSSGVTLNFQVPEERLSLSNVAAELITKLLHGGSDYVRNEIDPRQTQGAKQVSIGDLTTNIEDGDLLYSFQDLFNAITEKSCSETDLKRVREVALSKIRGQLLSKLKFASTGNDPIAFSTPLDVRSTATALSMILYYASFYPEDFRQIEITNKIYNNIPKRFFELMKDLSEKTPLEIELPRYEARVIYPRKPLMEPLTIIDEKPKREKEILSFNSYQQTFPMMGQLLKNTGFDEQLFEKSKKAAELPETKEREESLLEKDNRMGRARNQMERQFKDSFIKAYEAAPSKLEDLRQELLKLTDLKQQAELKQQGETARKSAAARTKDLEEELLAFANRLPEALSAKLFAQAKVLGQEHPYLKLDDLIALFVKSDLTAYLKATYFDEKEKDEIRKLYQMTGLYLVEATQLKHYKRSLEELDKLASFDKKHPTRPLTDADKLERDQILAKIGSVLYQKRSYDNDTDPDNFAAFLAFEYYEDILIFKEQKEILKVLLDKNRDAETGGFKDEIIQLIMGGGKSKVLMPLSAYQKAQGDNLVVVIVPASLRNTNYRDMKATSLQRFNQEVFPFQFGRSSDSSPENLTKIRDYLRNVVLKKGYLVTTNSDIQSLELKWMELLEQTRPEYKAALEKRKQEILIEYKKLWAIYESKHKARKDVSEEAIVLNKLKDESNKITKEINSLSTRLAEQLPILEEILELFNKRADVYVDEVDSIQDVRKELNYTLGEEVPLERHVINAIAALYRDIQSVPFPMHKKVIENGNVEYVSLGKDFTLENFFLKPESIPKLSEEEWKEVFLSDIVPNLVKALAENPDNPLNHILSSLDARSREAVLKFIKGEAEFPDKLQKLSRESKDIIALYKEQMNTFLPLTVYRTPKVNYGYTHQKRDESELVVAIPYVGNNMPSEESRFASPFETANYTAQLNYIYGVNETALKNMLLEFKDQAITEKNQDPGRYTIMTTPAAMKFKELTGIEDEDLFTLDPTDPSVLARIYKKLPLKSEAMKRVVDYCLPRYILNNVKSAGMILRHNADEHSHLYRSFQGGSGTILSPFVFDERTDFTKELGLGTDGRVIDYLISNDTKVTTPSSEEDITKSVSKLLNSDPNFRAIIDVGAHFKGVGNLEVAKQLAQYYQERKGSAIEWVLFYNDQNQLSALKVTPSGDFVAGDMDKKVRAEVVPEEKRKPEIRILGSSDPKYIESQLQCKPSQYFTYYDEQHTTGTDIRQMLGAKAICTFSAQTLKKDLLQGVMRMRDLANTQKVQLLLSNEMIKAHPEIKKDSWDIHKVLAVAEQNQKAKIEEDNFRVAMNKLRGLVRRDLLRRIRSEPNLATTGRYVRAFHQFIATEQSLSPSELFLGLERKQNTEFLLRREMAKLLEQWLSCLKRVDIVPLNEEIDGKKGEIYQETRYPGEKATHLEVMPLPCKEDGMRTTMEKILDRVKREKLCAETTKARRESSDAQVQTVKLVEMESAQEVLTEAKRLNQVKLEVNSMMMDESQQVTESLEVGTRFRSLNNFMARIPDVKLKPPPGLKFSKHLLMTENLASVFHGQTNLFQRKKPVDHIVWLYDPKKNEINAIMMTAKETEAYIRNEKNLPQISWITTSKGKPILGNAPDKKYLPKEYQTLREQIYYFNGDTDCLSREKETLSWIMDNFPEKIKFYENIILGCYPHKAKNFLFLKAELQKKFEAEELCKIEPEKESKFGQDKEEKIAMEEPASPRQTPILLAFQTMAGVKEEREAEEQREAEELKRETEEKEAKERIEAQKKEEAQSGWDSWSV